MILLDTIPHIFTQLSTHAYHTHTVSSQVQDLQLELKSLREQAGSAEGELVLKNQKLADAETEARMMRVRRDVLALQAKELQQTQGALERSSVSLMPSFQNVQA